MKRRSAIMFATVIFMLLAAQSLLFPAAELDWKTDWNSALKEAAAAKRPVLMDFYTDWCPPCKKLAKFTFKDNNMINYFQKENYLLIKVNPEKDRIAEGKFKVYSYPTLVIFNNKGDEIDRLLGFKTTEQLIKALEDLKKGIGTLEDLLGRYEKNRGQKTTENFALMFKIIAKYMARADYPEALEFVERIMAMDRDNTQKQASNALFQKGFIYYKWKKYKEAVEILLSLHQVYPKAEEAEEGFAAAAIYSKKLDDPERSLQILKDFVKQYPNSQYAKEFRQEIEKLEKPVKN
jgi:thiol-disulfide isomerase/thioredoxin